MKKHSVLIVVAIVFFSHGFLYAKTNLYWGDTHLHVSQIDRPTLYTAYKFAKGIPVIHPTHQSRIKKLVPLDFLVVSNSTFTEISPTSWKELMDAAEHFNDPGKFTTFIGWEWASIRNGAHLHRVVIMKEGQQSGIKLKPFTTADSDKPEDLWKWLDKNSKKLKCSFLSIPHHTHLSNGRMFPNKDSNGRIISKRYSRTRMKWEPLVVVTQTQGDAETHPLLSPDDELSDFETYVSLDHSTVPDKGSYVRTALKRGLWFKWKTRINPFQVGMIGGSDAYSGLTSIEENNFLGKTLKDTTPLSRKEVNIFPGKTGWNMSAAGLTGVWAENNTRESIFSALKRKEVYATSGPRIGLRFFGGWDFNEKDALTDKLAEVGYAKGIPMGGNLTKAPKNKSPSFVIRAHKDKNGANLDKIQIIKGWVDKKGIPHEKVLTIKESNDASSGESALSAMWKDPDFDPKVPAFYYVRVLEIPTHRHSTIDAIALGLEPTTTGHPVTIKERAYSSPIWYIP